jgi:hypothetical protein
VGKHQQDHYDERHSKKPQNDRHDSLQLFISGNIALSNNAVLATKFQRRGMIAQGAVLKLIAFPRIA